MTAQDLFEEVQDKIAAEQKALDTATKKNYMARRKAIIEAARAVYDSAVVKAHLDTDVGNTVYVSKAEAMKYGRMDKLDAIVREEAKTAAKTDISNLEKSGIGIYELSFLGFLWAVSQGFDVPASGTPRTKLVASALYSDFYGAPFDKTIKKNLANWPDDVMAMITREFNQGHGFGQMAKKISDMTDSEYWKALRVARTESGRISSQASLDSNLLLDELGIEYKKIWVHKIGFGSQYSAREDHLAFDGTPADDNGIFHLPSGASGPAPRETGNPGDDINCACFFVLEIDGQSAYRKRVESADIVPFDSYRDGLPYGGSVSIKDVRKARSG